MFYALVTILVLGIYFLPSLFALIDRKRNTVAIFALNLFLGWTFVGWVVALVWSLTQERVDERDDDDDPDYIDHEENQRRLRDNT